MSEEQQTEPVKPRRRLEREVGLEITEKDRAEYSRRIGELTAETDTIGDAFTKAKEAWGEAKKRFESDLEDREIEVREIRNIFKLGKHKKTVMVEEVRCFDSNSVQFFYEDKMVEEKPMTAHERQAEMDLQAPAEGEEDDSDVVAEESFAEEAEEEADADDVDGGDDDSGDQPFTDDAEDGEESPPAA